MFSEAHPLDDEWLKEYSLTWKRPRWICGHSVTPEDTEDVNPRGAQIEALHYLD